MVSYSAKLDSRTKQHTQFGVSASNSSRDMARTKVAEKKEKKEKRKKMNMQNHIASPMGIANNNNNNETGSRSPCMRPRSDPPKMKNSNVVRSRLIRDRFSVALYATEERSPELWSNRMW